MTEEEQMLTSVLGCRRIDLVVDPKPLNVEQKDRLQQMRQRRASGEPLQYIVGQCDFMGHEIFVNEHVLIPRPETEILVDTAVMMVKAARVFSKEGPARTLRVLDLGTGSGNIAVAMAKQLSGCRVVAVDISSEAIALARRNAHYNGVEADVEFVCADMNDFLKDVMAPESFDMIISNPPYIATDQIGVLPADVRREPRLALDGGTDGLDFYRAIVGAAHRGLAGRGILLMEIGDGQAAEIEKIFQGSAHYANVRFKEDYTQTKRIVMAEKGAVRWTN